MVGTAGIIIGGAVANTVGIIVAGKIGRNNCEQVRQDKATEEYMKAKKKYNEQRTNRLDFLNKTLRQQNHAIITFTDLDEAGREYFRITGQSLSPLKEPKFSDYYQKTSKEKNTEIYTILVTITITGFLAFKYL